MYLFDLIWSWWQSSRH